MSKAGFIAVVGRPNAGKSAFINSLIQEKLNMVSHKQNATRRRSQNIVHHDDAQMIFVDTPGIHQKEKLLNQFMLEEALKALNDCDISLFLSPISDDMRHYKDFLKLNKNKPHIVLLTKRDLYSKEQILQTMVKFAAVGNDFLALIPYSMKKPKDKEALLKAIYKVLPSHPFYFDEEIISTQSVKEICEDFVLEGIFEKVSDEIPYVTDVTIRQFDEKEIVHIHADIIVEKQSQKIVIIGQQGSSIKRIGQYAREQIEELMQKKVALHLQVVVKKGWSKNKELLKEQGYEL